jgi:hypothetical protein
LWAQKRGLEDLPRDPIDDTLARLRLGSMTGADLACLFKAGAEADSWHVELEAEPKAGGHIDALAIRKGPHSPHHAGCCWVLEFKSQWDESGPIKPPDKDHVNYLLQGSEYAQQPDIDAPRFKVVVLKPSAPRGKRLMQFEYDTSTWGPLATQDRARLEKAIASVEPPPGDPTEKWQCVLCRYGACPKNRNKLAESVEVALA